MAYKMKNPSAMKMAKKAGCPRTAMKMKAEEAAAMKMKKAAMKLKEASAMKMKKSAMKAEGDPKKEKGRTRLDDKLEKSDAKKDVFNPAKADKLADKAAKREKKAKEAIEKADQTGKGGGRASKLVKRAAKAGEKARFEAAKRGRDTNKEEREPKGVVRVKGKGGFTESGRYKKQTRRVLKK